VKKRQAISLEVFFLSILFTIIISLPALSQTIHGDFEAKRGFPTGHILLTMAEKFNFKFDPPIVPEGWTLGLSGASKDGKFSLESDRSQAYSGNNFIYLLKGNLTSTINLKLSANDEVNITFQAKNPEASSLTLILTFYNAGRSIGMIQSIVPVESKEWSQYTAKLTAPAEVNKNTYDSARLGLRSNNGVYIDAMEMSIKKSDNASTPVPEEKPEEKKEEKEKPVSKPSVNIAPSEPVNKGPRIRFDE